MFKTGEKVTLVGIGALALIAEKAEEMIRELTEKGETKREDLRNILQELTTKGEEKKAELIRGFCQEVTAKEKADFITRAEIEKLKERIARLEEKLTREGAQEH